jgi:hypothetical protein
MARFGTLTIQRVGLLDLTSIAERTIPVIGNPFNISLAFSPRYWRSGSIVPQFGPVITMVCMHH